MTKNISILDECTNCNKGPMVTDDVTGETFCSHCGYVRTERIEAFGPEWRSFSKEDHEAKSRTGLPTSLAMHDMGLATIIGRINKDASGKPLTASMRSTVERLRTWDDRSQLHKSVDRNYRQAFNELNRLKDKLALSDVVIEKTAYIYRRAVEKSLIRGRTISALLGATLYAACRDTETPRTLKDISSISNAKKKDLSRCYRLLVKELDLRMPVVNPMNCVAKIASKANLSEKTKRKALEVLEKARELRISAGKDPMGIAATALYIATTLNMENKTQKKIAEAAGITEVTIRNRCKDLSIALEL